MPDADKLVARGRQSVAPYNRCAIILKCGCACLMTWEQRRCTWLNAVHTSWMWEWLYLLFEQCVVFQHYYTLPDQTCLNCGLFVCFYCFRQCKEHSHHNPSYHSQSGARPHDSHSRGGVNAERQPSSPPLRRQRHDTDSSDGGSPAPRKGVSHKTAPAGVTQSHRRRHDTDSDN